MFYLVYSDVFMTIHKYPLFITPSCRTVLRLVTHVSLLQYSRSSNMWAFRRTLAHISAGYPCISSSWTQWMKNKINQIIAKKWKGFWHGQVLIIQITLGHFFLHGESCSSWCRCNFNFFSFIHFFFINLKDVCVNVV